MKKILMGTSALAMAGSIAGTAEAASWDLDWGGYYNSAIIYRTGDNLTSDEEGVDVVQDGEIEFRPSIVLDNGLQFGAIVQLEAEPRDGNTIDDSYVFIDGPFGHIDIGSEAGAASKMHFGAPNAGWFGAADGGDVAGYLDLGGDLNFGRSPAFAGAANRISYYTPRLAGFQIGASYAHDDNTSKNQPNGIVHNEVFDLGANYRGNFGQFSIDVGVVYSHADGVENAGTGIIVVNDVTGFVSRLAPGVEPGANQTSLVDGDAPSNGDDSDMYGGGISIGYAGFTFGGNYTEQDIGGEADEREYYDLGARYDTGPWAVSFQWAHSEQGSAEGDYYHAAATYDLGPGVTAGIYAGYAEEDSGVAGVDDVDGFLIGTGFALSF